MAGEGLVDKKCVAGPASLFIYVTTDGTEAGLRDALATFQAGADKQNGERIPRPPLVDTDHSLVQMNAYSNHWNLMPFSELRQLLHKRALDFARKSPNVDIPYEVFLATPHPDSRMEPLTFIILCIYHTMSAIKGSRYR